jgi:colanic acid biosynthesis protein WcaM
LRGIQISSGNATSFVAITNVNMSAPRWNFTTAHLFLRNINVMQELPSARH